MKPEKKAIIGLAKSQITAIDIRDWLTFAFVVAVSFIAGYMTRGCA